MLSRVSADDSQAVCGVLTAVTFWHIILIFCTAGGQFVGRLKRENVNSVKSDGTYVTDEEKRSVWASIA